MATVYFEDLVEGHEFVGDEVMVDKDEMLEYARKNDPWPFHVDEEAAKASPFGGLIASGGYAISLYYRLGHLLLQQSGFQVGIPGRVRLACQLPATHPTRRSASPQDGGPILKRLSSTPGRGVIDSVGTLINQNGEVVLRIEVASLIATRPSA
jgi:acyl dehydratase